MLDDPVFEQAESTLEFDPKEGYTLWSDSYDEPGNPIIALEEAVVRDLIRPVTPGRALDAACGTGRHAEHLARLGHQVLGVDVTPDMLARARDRVAEAEFQTADLRELPLEDASFELIVCGLALAHLPELDAPVGELARVLAPGWVSDRVGPAPVPGAAGVARAVHRQGRKTRLRPRASASAHRLPRGIRKRRAEGPDMPGAAAVRATLGRQAASLPPPPRRYSRGLPRSARRARVGGREAERRGGVRLLASPGKKLDDRWWRRLVQVPVEDLAGPAQKPLSSRNQPLNRPCARYSVGSQAAPGPRAGPASTRQPLSLARLRGPSGGTKKRSPAGNTAPSRSPKGVARDRHR